MEGNTTYYGADEERSVNGGWRSGDSFIESETGALWRYIAQGWRPIAVDAVGGSGDMTKAVYDLDDDGMVDAAPWAGISDKPLVFPPDTHAHDYADPAHTHDYALVYSPIAHDHAALYSVLAHGHDYAASSHDHAALYSILAHTHDYADPAHVHDYSLVYSALAHDHASLYSVLAHTHSYSDPAHVHDQYALLAGRAGGQTLYGGIAANEDITISGTSHATKTTSYVILQPTGGYVGIGITPSYSLHVAGNAAFNSEVSLQILTLGQTTTANPKQLLIGSVPASNYFSIQGVQQGVDYNQSIVLQPLGGSVGMGGKLDPGAKLSIRTGVSGATERGIFLENQYSASDAWGGSQIAFGYADGNENYSARILGLTNAYSTYGSKIALQTHSHTTGVWNPDVVLDDYGYFGIGIYTPSTKLHVYGGTTTLDYPGGALRIRKTQGVDHPDDLGIFHGSGHHFISDWATGNKGIRIDSDKGDVGIGGAPNGWKLYVAGLVGIGVAGGVDALLRLYEWSTSYLDIGYGAGAGYIQGSYHDGAYSKLTLQPSGGVVGIGAPSSGNTFEVTTTAGLWAGRFISAGGSVYLGYESTYGVYSECPLNYFYGKVAIGSGTAHSKLNVYELIRFANNAGAIAGGLTAGDFYADYGDPRRVCVAY